MRESEADQKKNNLYRIEFNCNSSILYNQPPALLPPPPLDEPPTSHFLGGGGGGGGIRHRHRRILAELARTKRNLQAPTVAPGRKRKNEENRPWWGIERFGGLGVGRKEWILLSEIGLPINR